MAKTKRNRDIAVEKKYVLGIGIPYYYNSGESEIKFKNLMQKIVQTLNFKKRQEILFYIYEDGQVSDWLKEYERDNIIIESCKENKGVSYARNKCLDYLQDKVLYIEFIDSDDTISDNYLAKMYEYCADNTHDIIESAFWFKGNLYPFLPKIKRSGCPGSAFKTNILGDLRFDENLQIGEDTKFMNELVDFSKHRKKYCKEAIYYYNYGANPKSLIVRYERKEIGKEFIKNGKRNSKK